MYRKLLLLCALLAIVASACAAPVEPIPATQPAQSTQPVQPAYPAQPAQLTQPTQAEQPAYPAQPTAVPSKNDSFTDPFAYCQAVGVIDQPDARYTGDAPSAKVAGALRKAMNLEANAELPGLTWRCMNGKVYGCTVGANLPCQAKANTNRQPTQEEQAYCQANPNSDIIPMSVTGHDTVYSWRCKNGVAESGQAISKVDAQGYIEDIWYLLQMP